MKVSHYFEWEGIITGGQKQSVKNQRKILDRNNIEYTTEPDLSADILHLNNMGPKSTLLALKAFKRDVKVVIHSHQTAEDFENSFAFSNIIAKPMKPYLKFAYSLSDHIICPSKYNKKVIDGYTDTPKTVISNGFDYEKLKGYENLRKKYLERYELTPPVVFNVGHVIKRKGLEDFVATARQMPNTDFVWFGFLTPTGGNNLVDHLLRSSDAEKIVDSAPENCTFTGYIEDIRGAFAAGDIFFFPSKNENEGMALLESMSAGKPVIVRDINVYDWLEHGETCLKTENNFSKQINKLKNPELREKIGKNAESKSQEFNLNKIGEHLISLYKDLV